MSGHSPEEVKKHIKVYLIVFFALTCFTVLTVAVSYLNVTFAAGVCIALTIAAIKGYLVCCHFMHLKSEKKIIFAVLLLTMFFFAMVFLLPLLTNADKITIAYVA